jgi:hypothetical protein
MRSLPSAEHDVGPVGDYRQTQTPSMTRHVTRPDGDGDGVAVWVGDGVPDAGGATDLLGFAGAA